MRPLRVGFLGAGRIASLHARYYLEQRAHAAPRAVIAAVCDTDRSAAEALVAVSGTCDDGDARGAIMMYDNLDALLRDDDAAIDAVEVLTPTPLHEEHAIACAEAGKHVHLQKPMANDLASAHKIYARRDSAEDFSRLGALLFTATTWIFIRAYCFAVP